MSTSTTISARVETPLLKKFKELCEILKINQSDFIRGCIVDLCKHKEPDTFLAELGFVKKTTWVYKEVP